MADAKNLLTESDDPQDNEELVIVEQDPNASADDAADVDDGEDERVARADDDGNDAEREAIRERRRQEKQERKERRDKAIHRDKVELDFLRKRNDDLERRLSGIEQRTHQQDLSGIDAQIAHVANELQMADQVIAKAVEAGNGSDVTKAMQYRDQARERLAQLNVAKNQVAQARPTQPAIDDLTLMHAQNFMSENSWYDPQGRDEDSAIVLAIDAALVRDGYDPKSADYWDELKRRASRRLPERFSESAPRKPRGGPAVGSGREHAPATTRREVYISPERKQALIEAGVWDDPVLRAKYVKRYAEYDRQKRS
jgi:hypothetical protein